MIPRFWQKTPTWPADLFFVSYSEKSGCNFSRSIEFLFRSFLVFLSKCQPRYHLLHWDKFEKSGPEYNMWYSWSLLTLPQPVDSLTETVKVCIILFWKKWARFKKVVNQSQFALFVATLKKLTSNQMKKNPITYYY